MPFTIVPGIPGVKGEIDRLKHGIETRTLSEVDLRLAKKLFKAIANLSRDPFYPALNSHEIHALTDRFGIQVFQSYLENQTPSAGRLYWVYGPQRRMITLVGMEPYPEDKKRDGYRRVELSSMPSPEDLAPQADGKDSNT